MDTSATALLHPSGTARPRQLQLLAATLSGVIAVLYGLLYLDVLSIAGASEDDIQILGVAAGLFAVLAVLVWRRRSRVLWAGIAASQVLMGAMYVAIAPERDPAFEVWGITIRVLSLLLLVTVVKLWLDTRHGRPGGER